MISMSNICEKLDEKKGTLETWPSRKSKHTTIYAFEMWESRCHESHISLFKLYQNLRCGPDL